MDKWDDSRINEKKDILAYELTALVHGNEEADKAREVSKSLFSGGGDDANMPTTEIPASEISDDGITIVDLMMKCGLCASKGDARRLIQQGGVLANGEKVADPNMKFTADSLSEGVKIRKGKKVFHKAIVK